MASFENFLWWIFIIFTLICGGFCIEAHYRYKNKNGIEDLEKAKEYIDRLIEFEKRSVK